MITFEEAMVLLCVRSNPLKNKTELLELLSESYRVSMNRAHLSALIDKLDTTGHLTRLNKLPRVYWLSPDIGFDALAEFNRAINRYNELLEQSKQRIEAIKNSDEFKRFLEGQ